MAREIPALLATEAFQIRAAATGRLSVPVKINPTLTGSGLRRVYWRTLMRKTRRLVEAAAGLGLKGSAAMDVVADEISNLPEMRAIAKVLIQKAYDDMAGERGLKISRPLKEE